MNDNVRVLDDERVRRVTAEQWEALAYLANRGSIVISPDETHPSKVLGSLLGTCNAARLCRADAKLRTIALTDLGRRTLAHRIRMVTIDDAHVLRLRDFLDCVAAPRRPQDDTLALEGMVRLHASDWTWRTEFGRLVAKLTEIGS